MERYMIWEGFMEDLTKKVKTIENKCKKFGCDFHFAIVGEEIKDIYDYTTINPITNTPVLRKCKFIEIEVDGTAIVNNWEFVATVEHTEKGNIFSKALTDVEIPERYRNSKPYCEHCHSNRARKNTCIIRNTETGEFKQVGNSCLKDFTCGMSASFVTWLASIKRIFVEQEEEQISFGGMYWGQKYFDTQEVLRYTAETIRHFGFSKSENDGDSTKERMLDIFHVCHGDTRYMDEEHIFHIRDLINEVGFNADSDEAKKMVADALAWLDTQESTNDYMHNMKVVTSLPNTTYNRFGLLVSLFPTYNRDLEREAARRAEAEQGKTSEWVGEVKDRITVDVESIKCLTSWDSCFDGYHETTTYIWKIVGKDGNIYTWKTSKWMDEDRHPVSIKGTVKEHKEYRGVKQTELTRCKIEEKPIEQKYEGSGQEGFDTFDKYVNA